MFSLPQIYGDGWNYWMFSGIQGFQQPIPQPFWNLDVYMIVLTEVTLLSIRSSFWTVEAADWLSLNAKRAFPMARVKEAL